MLTIEKAAEGGDGGPEVSQYLPVNGDEVSLLRLSFEFIKCGLIHFVLVGAARQVSWRARILAGECRPLIFSPLTVWCGTTPDLIFYTDPFSLGK